MKLQLIRFAISLLCATLPPFAHAQTTSPDELLRQAEQLRKDKKYSDAVNIYGQIINSQTDDTTHDRAIDELILTWKEIIRGNATSPENHIGLAQAYSFHCDCDRAAEKLADALKIDPLNKVAPAHQQKLAETRKTCALTHLIDDGVDLQLGGAYDLALDRYEKALASTTDNSHKATINLNIGAIYQKQQDYIQARAYYKETLKLASPGSPAEKGAKAGLAAVNKLDTNTSDD